MDADGNPIFTDLNGDGQIGTDDMTDIGRTTPSFTYGVNVTAAWKGFDLLINGYGQGGNKILPVIHSNGYKNGLKWYLDNARTPENPDGTIPHPGVIMQPNVPFWSSTGNLFSGNYFRVKQLQLGYTIPGSYPTMKKLILGVNVTF